MIRHEINSHGYLSYSLDFRAQVKTSAWIIMRSFGLSLRLLRVRSSREDSRRRNRK
jgi:hypothetical protein